MKETIKELEDPFAAEPMDAKNHFYKSDYSRNWGNKRYLVVFLLLGLIFLMMFLIIFVLHIQGQKESVDCVSIVSHREIFYQSINRNGKPVNVSGFLFSIDEANVNTKRNGIVWNHGGFNTTSDKNTLCELARLGYVVFGPNFQEGNNEPDYLGTQIEDSLRALNYLKKYRQTNGMNVFMGGEGNGASITLLAIQRLRRLSSFDVPKIALRDITYNPTFQIYNSFYLDYTSKMFEGLERIYQMNKQKVIDNIIIPRSPSLPENQQFLADVNVLITAARGSEIVNFANSNQLAGDLQELSIQHKLIAYDTDVLEYNGTVLTDWLEDVSLYLK